MFFLNFKVLRILSFFLTLIFSVVLWSKDCEFIGATSQSRFFQCDKVKVIKVKGSPEDKAKAFVYWFKKEKLSLEPIKFFSKSLNRSSEKNWYTKFKTWSQKKMSDFLFKGEFKKGAFDLYREMKTMAEGLGKSWEEFQRVFYVADLGAIVPSISKSIPMTLLNNVKFLGCTSVMVTNEKNEFLYARNLDYSGAGVYDKYPLVVIRYPDKPKQYKTIAFSTHGFFLSSITGMNEKGLTYSLHQTYSNVASTRGIPILVLGEKILLKSKNIEEALAMLKTHRPGTLWNIHLSDLNTGEAASVFISKDIFQVFRSKPPLSLVATNHFPKGVMEPYQLITLPHYKNSVFREKKAHQILKEKKGQMSLEDAVKVLGYRENLKNPRIYNDIGKFSTIQSVLWKSNLSSKEKEIYVSQQEAPSILGSFLKFDFKNLFSDFDKNIFYDNELFFKSEFHEKASKRATFYNNKKNEEKKERPSVSEFYQAYLLYSKKKFKELINFLDQNKKAIESYPRYLKESFMAMREMGYFHENKNYQSKVFSKKAQNFCDPYFRGKTLEELSEASLLYSVFSGGLLQGYYPVKEFTRCQ